MAAQSLNQRSTPDGRVVGRLSGGDQVVVYERKGSWARVSPEGSSARWVSSKLLCGDVGCYSPRPSPIRSRDVSNPRPARSNYSGSGCPCSGSQVCIGPRGGRYCITSGGNKRYGV
ncbi:MAG: SH3 domain-containing protein [Stenotrophomonas sp.]